MPTTTYRDDKILRSKNKFLTSLSEYCLIPYVFAVNSLVFFEPNLLFLNLEFEGFLMSFITTLDVIVFVLLIQVIPCRSFYNAKQKPLLISLFICYNHTWIEEDKSIHLSFFIAPVFYFPVCDFQDYEKKFSMFVLYTNNYNQTFVLIFACRVKAVPFFLVKWSNETLIGFIERFTKKKLLYSRKRRLLHGYKRHAWQYVCMYTYG